MKLIFGSSTKNDRNDARALGDLLRTDYLPVAHLRDLETREKLSVVNDRVTYGSRRGELKGTIKWLLKRRGIEVDSPFSDDGLREVLRPLIQELHDDIAQEFELFHSCLDRGLGRRQLVLVGHLSCPPSSLR